MKELDLEYMNNEGIAAFEGEIRVLELLPHHPNIVRYLFHENKNKKLRLFMTRYSTTLNHEIATRQPTRFPVADIRRYGLDMVRGLEFLHSHQIIHRDLKSENIFVMLNERREIIQLAIGDFDTAKKVSAKNQAKTVLGTPQWMAPEVLNANEEGGYGFPADGMSLLLQALSFIHSFIHLPSLPSFLFTSVFIWNGDV
jgi:serine/threonine protein kinase